MVCDNTVVILNFQFILSFQFRNLQSKIRHRPFFGVVVAGLIAIVFALAGCDVERRKSDAELGLNPQQAAGRKLYDNYCDRCHEP